MGNENTNEETWLRRFLKPGAPFGSSTVLTRLAETLGSTGLLISSTLSGLWPGLAGYGKCLDDAAGPARELADALSASPVPPSIDAPGMEFINGHPLFRVHSIPHRASSSEWGWFVGFWCPFCRAAHGHRWGRDYDTARAYFYKRVHCLGSSPLNPDGYYLTLDAESRYHIEQDNAR